jgi:hypothetical protein
MTIRPSDSQAAPASSSLASRGVARTRRPESLRRWLARWSRWLHIYVSMFGLATILFFSATGVTLNHPDWFFEERHVERSGTLPKEWLNTGGAAPADWDQTDYSHEVAKLEIAERLRAEHALRGVVSDFLAFEDECELTFQGPAYAAVARIDRTTGEYTIDVIENDLISLLNDLHKGRNTGRAWSWVIDVSAVIGVLISVTGFVLIFFIRLRRRRGLVTAAVGCLLLWGMYLIARH